MRFLKVIACVTLFVNLSSSVRKCPEQDPHEVNPVNTGEFLRGIIRNCSYDRLRPPPTTDSLPVKVFIKVYFYFLKSYEAHDLQFSVYLLIQCRFLDPRLQFDPTLHKVTEIVGTKELSQLLWVPHIYFGNERQSVVMGPGESDVMAHIVHDGTVLYTKRMHTTLFCWMKLKKFPFDYQECSLILDSWTYNTTYLTLEWEEDNPVHYRNELTLTEFSLVKKPVFSSIADKVNFDKDLSGDFQGNYRSLTVTFHLKREYGFYMYDYFIPSILLVAISWVSFWLEADAPLVSGRVILCCSTMLAFIILSVQMGSSLPRVSYVKASEIWFMGCTAFIFGSLVEFAFANRIYRKGRRESSTSKKDAEIKENTVVQRSTVKSSSCPDFMQKMPENNDSLLKSVLVRQQSVSWSCLAEMKRGCRRKDPQSSPPVDGAGMTPREMSIWLDEKSRIIFPVSFVCFVALYWCYLYIM